MRTDILERKEDILKWISQNQSKAYMCQQLHCKQETLNSYLKKMKINYAGNQSGKGQPDKNYKTAEEYIKSTDVKSSKLKEKLIRDGLRENKCELCGISTWRGINLVLQLHHKNGNHYDNNLNNLMILCPNCHSIQESHKKSRQIYNSKNGEVAKQADAQV